MFVPNQNTGVNLYEAVIMNIPVQTEPLIPDDTEPLISAKCATC